MKQLDIQRCLMDTDKRRKTSSVAKSGGWPGMASLARYGMEMREMQERPRASATTSVAVDEPIPQARAAGAPGEGRATDVLISEQEVVFSAAAAVAPQRPGAGQRLLTSLWRVLAGSTNASHRRPYSPPYYLECARLSREIDRL
jgi:hypothetical protein